MFEKLQLQLLELYRMQKSTKLDKEEQDALQLELRNLETRLEQLENHYEEVRKIIENDVNAMQKTLKQRTPSYNVK